MPVSAKMPQYQSHKKVHALKIAAVEILHEDKSATISPADRGFAPFTTQAGWAERFKGSDDQSVRGRLHKDLV